MTAALSSSAVQVAWWSDWCDLVVLMDLSFVVSCALCCVLCPLNLSLASQMGEVTMP
jgi:hypothetical protein